MQALKLRISPDEQNVLVATGATNYTPGTCPIILYDRATGKEIHVFDAGLGPQEEEFGCAVVAQGFSLDGNTAIEAKTDAHILVWDVDPDSPTYGEKLRTFGNVLPPGPRSADNIVRYAFSNDQSLVFAGLDGYAALWDVETGEMLYRFDNIANNVFPPTFSPDDQMALIIDQNVEVVAEAAVILVDVTSGEEIRRWEGLGWAFTFNSTGDWFLAQENLSTDFSFIMVDVTTGEILRRFPRRSSQPILVQLSPDDRFALSLGYSGEIVQWDIAQGEATRVYPAYANYYMELGPDARSFVLVDRDHYIQEWKIDTLEELVAWVLENRYIRDLTCEEREQYNITPLCE